jgi:hypothetical protein
MGLTYDEPQSLMPNFESEFYVSDDLTTALEDVEWVPVMGITEINNNFDPTTLTRAYYNDGGAQREYPIGFKFTVDIAGDRDLNDEGQNLLFDIERIFATGTKRQIRCKYLTEEFTITGVSNQAYGIAQNGEALEFATFDLAFTFQGTPKIIETPTTP